MESGMATTSTVRNSLGMECAAYTGSLGLYLRIYSYLGTKTDKEELRAKSSCLLQIILFIRDLEHNQCSVRIRLLNDSTNHVHQILWFLFYPTLFLWSPAQHTPDRSIKL